MVISSSPLPVINMASEGIPKFFASDDLQTSSEKNDAETEEEPVHLEEESKRRRDRLRALRQKLLGDQADETLKKIDAPLPK